MPKAAGGAVGTPVVTDDVILLASLRLVGVDASALSTAIVLGGFFLAYPLTALPLAGLGVADAVLVVALTETAGTDWEAQIVAALIVWPAVTLIGTELLGAAAFGWWRWRTAGGLSADASVHEAA